jgi:hypothetical protein
LSKHPQRVCPPVQCERQSLAPIQNKRKENIILKSVLRSSEWEILIKENKGGKIKFKRIG